jgi:hypothetical protein
MANVNKKKFPLWGICLVALAIVIVWIIIYAIVIPILYGKFIFVTKWVLEEFDFNELIGAIKNTITDPNKVGTAVVTAIIFLAVNWILFAGLIATLFWLGFRLHFDKAPISENARLTGKEPSLKAMSLRDEITLISGQDVSAAKQAVYSVYERLKNESDFGSGKDAVINCENEIADCFDAIEAAIPALGNADTNAEATATIEMNCKKIMGKLKTRVELKKR